MNPETLNLTELPDGKEVRGEFGVHACESRTAKNGNRYVSLALGNKSCTFKTALFNRIEAALNEIKIGGVLDIKGKVKTFAGSKTIDIEEWFVLEGRSSKDIAPSAECDISAMKKDLFELCKCVTSQELLDVLKDVLTAAKPLTEAPAALSYHSNYRGGLLHHTLGVARLCKAILDSGVFPELNSDVLLTSAILHDIGKVSEYGINDLTGAPERHASGDLQGHIFIGAHTVANAGVGSPSVDRVIHAILSHHGQLEWGSPVTPVTMEAIVLHCCDMMEAKLSSIHDAFKGIPRSDGSIIATNEALKVIGNKPAYR